MQERYEELKAKWLAGDRKRELGLSLMFFAWMHWADPSIVTGMAPDPMAADLWRETFTHFGGENSADAEFLYVSGIMAELFPWVLGDETEWEQRGLRMQARAKEIQPGALSVAIFSDRGEYGEYFANQLRGGSIPS